MAITETNPVTVGNATKKSDFDVAMNNTIALKQAGTERDLGGDWMTPVTDTAFVPVPGARIVELDATNLGGFTTEVHVTCKVDAGTGSIRLWDITAGAAVGATQTFSGTSFALVKITALIGLLAAASHQYRLEVKGAAATDLPVVAGAVLLFK